MNRHTVINWFFASIQIQTLYLMIKSGVLTTQPPGRCSSTAVYDKPNQIYMKNNDGSTHYLRIFQARKNIYTMYILHPLQRII